LSAREQRIYFLLQQAAHRLKKTADRSLLEDGGLTTAQAAVLRLVSESGDASQRELARTLRLNESAMTAMVGRLSRRRLIRRVRDPDDARSRRISLTEAGREALARSASAFAAINSTLDDALGATRIDRLATDLRAVIDAFELDQDR